MPWPSSAACEPEAELGGGRVTWTRTGNFRIMLACSCVIIQLGWTCHYQVSREAMAPKEPCEL